MGNMRSGIGRRGGLTRRQFVEISALASGGALAGCMTNPVTGRSQFSLVSEAQEIQLDQSQSPHQFSADFGPVQQPAVNDYINRVGQDLTKVSHRPQMPYSFRAVNASHVNAYAFPGGSIAATRGILLSMDSEAELSGLLGHEVGHVCARHAAARQSSAMLAQLVIAAAAIAASQKKSEYGDLVAGLGGIGAGALLAHYSRDDERQADALGMEYMVKAGHNPEGMVGLMDILRGLHKGRPSALDLMFASHPMSDERYATAVRESKSRFASGAGLPLDKERYMDETAPIRKLAPTIEAVQKADELAGGGKLKDAEAQYAQALKATPEDYESLLKMSHLLLKLNRPAEAKQFAERAKAAYPQEAQALQVAGVAALQMRRFDDAHANLDAYARRLPGNPSTSFYDALALDSMGRKEDAARAYAGYLQQVNQGDEAKHAYTRLVQMGYIKPQQ